MHASDSNKPEVAPVCTKDVFSFRPEDGSLPDLGPSLQDPKPKTMAEVTDQVYDTILHEEVRHSLALWYHCFTEVHIQVTGENGIPEVLQGLLQVRQVLQR